jgi:hypothetical protein
MTSVKLGVVDRAEPAATFVEPERLVRARVLPWLWMWISRIRRHPFLIALAAGVFLRYWRLNAVGFNSDEAVYAGQAASIAGQSTYLPYFPIFRAHPLLFQSLLSLPYQFGVADVVGRLLAAGFGVATLVVVYHLGKLWYGRRVGIAAMALLAVMPYHVTVSRQVLLDAPMVFFATAALYALVRYCTQHGTRWLVVAGALMGLAMITKETAIVLFGGVYCFFVLSQAVKVRLKPAALALAVDTQRRQLSGLAAVSPRQPSRGLLSDHRSHGDRPPGFGAGDPGDAAGAKAAELARGIAGELVCRADLVLHANADQGISVFAPVGAAACGTGSPHFDVGKDLVRARGSDSALAHGNEERRAGRGAADRDGAGLVDDSAVEGRRVFGSERWPGRRPRGRQVD